MAASYQQPVKACSLTSVSGMKWTVISAMGWNHLLPLKHYNLVRQQIVKLQFASFFNDIRVFAHQQPANMSEEEAPNGVVRISICLWIFVVNSVVSCPFKDIILRIQGQTQITYTVATTWYLVSKKSGYYNSKCVLVWLHICVQKVWWVPEMPWN